MPKDPMPKSLKQYAISLEPVAQGKQLSFDPCDGKIIGRRSKLGGIPDWLQGEDVPNCEDCGKPMTFIGQIDSIEHDQTGNPHQQPYDEQEYIFGDVGLIYVFYCFDCSSTRSVCQCY